MSEIRRSGLKPLRSSTNIINNKISLLNRKSQSLDRSSIEKCEPKVSVTEQMESKTPKTKSTVMSSNKSSSKESKNQSHHKFTSVKKTISRQTTLTSNGQIRKSVGQSLEKIKVKKAIKIIVNKEQRIKQWLTSKTPIEDSEYWRLSSERLSKELTEKLDRLDEIELENELLVAEYEEMSKLAENARKLSKIFDQIGLTKLLNANDFSNDRTLDSTGQNDSAFDDSINRTLDLTDE